MRTGNSMQITTELNPLTICHTAPLSYNDSSVSNIQLWEMSWIRELWWGDAGWMGSIQRGAHSGLEPLYSIRPCRAYRLTKSYLAAALCTQIHSYNALVRPQTMSPFPASHLCISAFDLFTIETWILIKFWIKSAMSCCLYLKECNTRTLTITSCNRSSHV